MTHPQNTQHGLIYHACSMNHGACFVLSVPLTYPGEVNFFHLFLEMWGSQLLSFAFRNAHSVSSLTLLTSFCSPVELSFCQEEKLIHSYYVTISIAVASKRAETETGNKKHGHGWVNSTDFEWVCGCHRS